MSQMIEYTNDIKVVNVHLFERYYRIIDKRKTKTSLLKLDNLLELCDKAVNRVDDFTIDKHSRWLGYIQGFLAANGLIDVQVERDYTRILYQNIYKKYNIKQETI